MAGGGRSAVVEKVKVAVPGAVTELGEIMQVPCGIAPVQASPTDPVKPPKAPTVTVIVAEFPGDATVVVAGAVTLKSQAVPLKATDCGLLEALSVMVINPVRGLLVVEAGMKVTAMVQVPFTCTVAPLHVLV